MSIHHVTPEDIAASFNYGLAGLHGIDMDVAEDLGIPTSPESVARQVASAELVKQLLNPVEAAIEKSPAEKTSAFICGDCSDEVPCGHIGVTKSGKRYPIGY